MNDQHLFSEDENGNRIINPQFSFSAIIDDSPYQETLAKAMTSGTFIFAPTEPSDPPVLTLELDLDELEDSVIDELIDRLMAIKQRRMGGG